MRTLPPWLAYVLPLAVFLVITSVEMKGGVEMYPLIYTGKIVLVALLLAFFARSGAYPELRASTRYLGIAAVLGVLLCGLWVGIDSFTPHFAFLGGRASLNPFETIRSVPIRYGFLAMRFFGLVAVVPVMEELFFRSFLLRYAIDPVNFKNVPVGQYELISCIVVVLLMAGAHPEWLAAAVFSLVMNLLVYRTKDLFACVLTHGATNLALGIYVIVFHAWRYW